MGFFSKLFKVNNSQKANFLGSIQVDLNKIVCKDFKNTSNDFEIDILSIEYIYVTKTEHQVASLMIYQNGQKFLPTNFTGFNEVYNALVEKLKFTKVDFYQIIEKNTSIQKEIYRRKRPQNFEILSAKKYNDAHLGFEIQSPEKEFVSWDLPFQEMIKNKKIEEELVQSQAKLTEANVKLAEQDAKLQNSTVTTTKIATEKII